MRRGMMKPYVLKVIRYCDGMVDRNKYLDVLPGAKSGGKVCQSNYV